MNADRKATIAELLAQDRQKLLMKLPFTGSLVMRLDLVPVSDDRLDTAATDGDRVFVDVSFYSKLTATERLFVLAHEVWHCALLHFLRRQDRDRTLFNVAADLEIHFLLTDEGLEAPFVLPHDPRAGRASPPRRSTSGSGRGIRRPAPAAAAAATRATARNRNTSRGGATARASTGTSIPARTKGPAKPAMTGAPQTARMRTIRPSDHATMRPKRASIRTTRRGSRRARRSGAASG